MPSFSALTRQKIVSALLPLPDGESVTMQIDSNRVTPYWINNTQTRIDANDTLSLPRALSEVIVSWDVPDAEPNEENLSTLSFPLMGEMFQLVMETALPGAAEGNESSQSQGEPLPDSEQESMSSPSGLTNSASPKNSASLSPT